MMTEAELKIMKVIWEKGTIKASDLYKIMEKRTNWNKNTSYTMIKKCVEKGYIERIEPGFYCKALISENKVFHNILNKFFDNSVINFFQSFITKENLSESEISKLKEIVDKIED